ncbi:MAG: hypothetical protein HY650_10745 [Acidobacteria bacterium]|nr:hypothetical protein [Acidobacteriota bacterium]
MNRSTTVERQDFDSLLRRLGRAGFKKELVQRAILPDWWDDGCSRDPDILQDIEIRVARFLGASLAVVRDSSALLAPPRYPTAQLRRVRDVDRDRLGPAIHTAMRIAAAVVRSLRGPIPDPAVPPADGLRWREVIERSGPTVTLKDILADLWKRGVPVIPLNVFPTPGFQGIACIVEDRPVILLGYKHDEPGRVAFLVAHEVGHIAAGDCGPEGPVVDEEDEIADDSGIEIRADFYATQVVAGDTGVPPMDDDRLKGFKDLARQALDLERRTGSDASAVVFAWARRTGDYAAATMAVRALYRATGARKQLHQLFDQHVEIEAAAETDRVLLQCIDSDSQRNEAAG